MDAGPTQLAVGPSPTTIPPVDPFSDSDSDDDRTISGKVFLGPRKSVEKLFEPIVNAPHTVVGPRMADFLDGGSEAIGLNLEGLRQKKAQDEEAPSPAGPKISEAMEEMPDFSAAGM